MAEKKLRVRFGLRLTWPITNAAIFVMHVETETYAKIRDAVTSLKAYLELAGRSDIANRIVCEVS